MKHDENRSSSLIWSAIMVIAVGCLLMYAAFTEITGLSEILRYGIIIILSVIELAMVYILVRKFFGRKK